MSMLRPLHFTFLMFVFLVLYLLNSVYLDFNNYTSSPPLPLEQSANYRYRFSNHEIPNLKYKIEVIMTFYILLLFIFIFLSRYVLVGCTFAKQ